MTCPWISAENLCSKENRWQRYWNAANASLSLMKWIDGLRFEEMLQQNAILRPGWRCCQCVSKILKAPMSSSFSAWLLWSLEVSLWTHILSPLATEETYQDWPPEEHFQYVSRNVSGESLKFMNIWSCTSCTVLVFWRTRSGSKASRRLSHSAWNWVSMRPFGARWVFVSYTAL